MVDESKKTTINLRILRKEAFWKILILLWLLGEQVNEISRKTIKIKS
jgi:hypothetical protein